MAIGVGEVVAGGGGSMKSVVRNAAVMSALDRPIREPVEECEPSINGNRTPDTERR